MTVGGLFEGIGGFPLAAILTGNVPIWSNEIDSWCCEKLRENFEHEIIEADIRTIGKHNLKSVDIITGGFPCPPFSVAGKRKGREDNRFLWPEMLRIIKELNPTWVIGENVAGLISMEDIFEQVCSDLENQGYKVQPYIIPAGCVGSIGRRERVWFLAHSEHNGHERRKRENIERQNVLPEIFSPRFKTGSIHEVEEILLSKPGCIKDYNGVSRKLVKKELIAYGNAIDPRVAIEIFKAINQVSK